MTRLALLLLFFSASLGRLLGADSVVVFNEVNYHPVTNEAALEWIELHNQMAVDIDLSAWFLEGDVDYRFGEGTIIPGGGYLIVAADPAALQAGTGLTNVAGPFTGRLNNAAGRIELRDRNERLMDLLEFRDSGKWPVAPDGSGATLAKRDPDSPSAPPENWTSSVLLNGTPGRRNFPVAMPPRRSQLIPFDGLWRYDASGTDRGAGWREPQFDDTGWLGRNSATLVSYWPFDGSATAIHGSNGTLVGSVSPAADRQGAAGAALAFNGAAQQSVQVAGGGGLNGATAGTISLWVKWTGTQDADCCGTFGAVLARQANGLFSDNIIALSTSSPATARVVWRQSGGPAPVLITGTTAVGTNWHHVAVTFATGSSTLYLDGIAQGTAAGSALNSNPAISLSIGAWSGDGAGFATASIDEVAIWDRPLSPQQIAQLAAQAQMPLDFAAPENAVYFAGDGRLASNDDLRRTPLPLGPTTYYFRNTFQYNNDPAGAALELDLAVDDGAILYLNGLETYRHNMPPGEAAYATLAASEVGDTPLLGALALATTGLVRGTNVLAVEVHQAAAADLGMTFGAVLTAVVSPVLPVSPEEFEPGGLAFNEVSAGGAPPLLIELINRSAAALDIGGYILRRTGSASDQEHVLPAQTLAPGEFVVLAQAITGLGGASGDKLFLLRPDQRGVADAVEIAPGLVGRWPDGGESWLTPSAATFGTSNRFVFQDDVIINEIMYHHRPTLEVPAVIGSDTFVNLTNLWRYEQSGADLGTAWREPGYDDDGWPIGQAALAFTTNNLPVPENTELEIGPTTYYFRTAFLYTGTPRVLALSLRHVVDDGAVFYLNGSEITRFNVPPGALSHTNFASASLLNATLRAPVVVALTNLALGQNVLAAEVHQAANSGNDVAFGAELVATVETTPRLPYEESTEQWIELYNRGTNRVELSGWRLDEGIDFRFPPGTTIPGRGYLVVAKDPAAFQVKYPAIPMAGPYTNSLSRRGERLVLKDASGNPADEVHYLDGDPWPDAADGGGSSLELRDPFADNTAAEAWAASDEGAKSVWRTYSYRGAAAASAVGPDSQWREFVMGLLEAGEVWLDDISVIETPATTPVELIQNGTFDTGTNKWRIIGNHRGEVIDDPAQPGNKVLRLVAEGPTEHMSNHGETTLAGGRSVVNGREYLISFRAKWIHGSPQFHTRLYFNRLARTTLLDAPERHGTPGAENSRHVTNLGPTFSSLRHEPPVPAPLAPVTVSVRAGDPDGIAALTLWHSVNGGPWQSAPMTLQPFNPSTLQLFSGEVPGQAAATVVQFYVEAEDVLGAKSTCPAGGKASRALCKVDDGRAATNGLHNVRLVVLPAEADALHRTVNLMSNGRIGCTLVYDEQEVFYDCGLRLKGSEHSRTTSPRLGFNVNFPADRPFRGVHGTVAIDRSESTGFGQREMLIHQTANHAGGLPTKYHDLIHVLAPRLEHTGAAELQLARYSDVFLDDQFDRGSEGMVFEYELIYQLNTTDTGTPEGNKVPAPDSVVGTSIRNLGNDKEAYRWDFLIKNNEVRDDYNRLIEFCKAMELSGAAFTSQITNLIEVDQWLRGFALCVLSGAGDNYGGDGAQHNVQFYVRPDNGRVLFFPHDVDAFFDASRPIVPGSDLPKLMAVPAHARAYYGHLRDMLTTTYNSAYLTRWANHYGRLLPAQNFASHLAFIVQRGNLLNSQINSAVPNVAFTITSNSGNNFGTTNSSVVLTGTASLPVKTIEVNGVAYPITWTSTTAWRLDVPVLNGANLLRVQGVDNSGRRPTNALDTITVTNSGPGAPLPVRINEWMADNASSGGRADPLDGLFQDWFELFNPNSNAVSLAGFHLTDNLAQPTKWAIPGGTLMGPLDFLLIWADNEPEQNLGATNGHLHAAFQLNNDGEVIALFNSAGVPQHIVTFGLQAENVSQGLFPDGDTNAFYFMTNWTPRASNVLGLPESPRIIGVRLEPGGHTSLTFTAVPDRSYAIEFKEVLDAPVWTRLASPVRAAGATVTFTDTHGPRQQRFYRVALVW